LTKCSYCEEDELLPFQCPFCHGNFCSKHRLPENHECGKSPPRTPLGPWYAKKTPKSKVELPKLNSQRAKKSASEGQFHFVKSEEKLGEKKPFATKNKFRVIIACSIVILILGGFAYAYMNNLNTFNQTKSYLKSLGYDISNNVSGIDISTFLKVATIVPMVDITSFISIAKQNNVTTIYEARSSFYIVSVWIIVLTAYEYTPNYSIWWIWG